MLKKKQNLKTKLIDLFKSLKIRKNSKIMLHGNSAGLYQFNFSKNRNSAKRIFFRTIIDSIGKSGEIVVPTYNYDFTKNKPFYYNKINSQVGELSNFFLKSFNIQRTLNPVFNHSMLKKKQNKNISENQNDCLGSESFFNYLHKENFKIIGFCAPLSVMTFVLYVECLNKVKHRFYKEFRSKIIKNNQTKFLTIKYFVAKKRVDCSPKSHKIEKALKNFKSFQKKDFGRFNCWSVDSQEVFKGLTKKLKLKDNYIISKR